MIHLDGYVACATYVGTQFCYVYEHPESYICVPDFESLPTALRDWMSLIDEISEFFRGKWWATYRRMFNENLQPLAVACHKHFASVRERGATWLFYADDCYPPFLKEIPDPPFAINVLGDAHLLSESNLVSIVGSRRATPFALNQSFELGKELAKSRVGVVSGGAYGCDIAAHHGVLSTCISPCKAIVVLAGGLINFYPKANSEVFCDIIAQGGAVLSEKLWSQPARAIDFPVRNRIIAGICKQILVVQAGIKSGAMLTANRSLDFGREVYVLMPESPGLAFDGNQKLLFDGAFGFSSTQDYIYKNFFAMQSV